MSGRDEASVLVVEDERHLADLFAGWLGERYAVETAYDGYQALEALDPAHDVVLLDRRMPGLSGDEVLKAMGDRGLECKVAMVTAVEPDFDILDMGFDDYLVKPVSYQEMRGTVDRLLRRRDYDEQLDEYAELVSKRAALAAEKNRAQLEMSEEFARLEARVDQLGDRVDRMVEGFEESDFTALLHDLPAGGRC